MQKLIKRDALINNPLDRIEQLEEKVRRLETIAMTAGAADQRYAALANGFGAETAAWATAVSSLMMFPGLVGLWTGAGAGGGIGNPEYLTDISGNNLHLELNAPASHTRDGLAPFVNLAGTGSYYRVGAPIFDIDGTESFVISALKGLTIGGLFQFDRLSTTESLAGKWATSGNNSYLIQKQNTNEIRFAVEDGSSNVNTVDSASFVSASGTYFCAGRYKPSSEVAVFLGSEKTTSTTSVVASLRNSTVRFEIGARDTGARNFLDGRFSMVFLCAAAVPDDIIEKFFEISRPLYGL